MLNATFAYQNMGLGSKFRIYHPCTIFTPQLCHNFATYLPRENLCRFIFSFSGASAYAAGICSKTLKIPVTH